MGFEITCRACEVDAYVTDEDGAALFLSMHDHTSRYGAKSAPPSDSDE